MSMTWCHIGWLAGGRGRVYAGPMVMLVLVLQQMVNAEKLRVPEQHATIQEAIDQSKAGDQILVQPGTYKERLKLKPGVSLRSIGGDEMGQVGLQRAERTIIDGGGDAGDNAGVQMAEGSRLDGFTVTNVGKYDSASWERHHLTSGNEQPYDPIGAPGIAGISVDDVDCDVMHNIVHHIGYTGIAVQGPSTTEARVFDNVCYRNMGGGIGFMNQSRGHAKRNHCFENFYAGIGHENASPVIIDNRCWNNIRAGIGISEGACPVVMRNHCYGNRRAGIGVRSGHDTRPVIQDNDCYSNGMAGIGAEKESQPVIRANRCYRNKMAGIGSRSGASPMIVGNECYENEMSGIGQGGNATPTLIDNHCHHNQLSGLGFDACERGVCVATGNRVVDNGKVAVGVQAGWDVTLLSNHFERTGGLPPIVMVFAGSKALLRDNVISGEGVAGVRVAGSVVLDQNRLIGKNMRPGGPPNFGIWALQDSDVTLMNNSFSNWRHAVHASQAKLRMEGNTASTFHRAAFHLVDPRPGSVVLGNQVTASAASDAIFIANASGWKNADVRVEGNELVPVKSK